MTNPVAQTMVSGGVVFAVALCAVMVIYGFLKVRSILSRFSSRDTDGGELMKIYMEFKQDVEKNRVGKAQGPDLSQQQTGSDAMESYFVSRQPPSDRRLLH